MIEIVDNIVQINNKDVTLCTIKSTKQGNIPKY